MVEPMTPEDVARWHDEQAAHYDACARHWSNYPDFGPEACNKARENAAQHEVPATIGACALHGREVLVFFHYH